MEILWETNTLWLDCKHGKQPTQAIQYHRNEYWFCPVVPVSSFIISSVITGECTREMLKCVALIHTNLPILLNRILGSYYHKLSAMSFTWNSGDLGLWLNFRIIKGGSYSNSMVMFVQNLLKKHSWAKGGPRLFLDMYINGSAASPSILVQIATLRTQNVQNDETAGRQQGYNYTASNQLH